MAFCNKLSGLLRQGVVSQSSNVPMTSMLGSLRYNSTTVHVSCLSGNTDGSYLKKAFSIHGDVIEATVFSDRVTGRSRCFGYVRFVDEDSANNAIKEMDGKELNGRNIRVILTNIIPASRPVYECGGGFRGGGGGGGGGY